MMFTANQLVAHAIGDYVLQSSWMAKYKTQRFTAALVHGCFYVVPFCFLSAVSVWSWLVIITTHVIIDRYRLARYVVWLKNDLVRVPLFGKRLPLTATGYDDETPPYLAVWLFIITDNLMHIVINALALKYL